MRLQLARRDWPSIGWLRSDEASTLMRWARGIVVVLGLVLGAWMTLDGARALAGWDYATPSQGEYAGRLGPWADLVKAVGLDPRSSVVKGAHVVVGLAWIGSMGGFALRRAWAGSAVLTCAVATLWYLPVGTLVSIMALVVVVASSKLGDGRRSSVREPL